MEIRYIRCVSPFYKIAPQIEKLISADRYNRFIIFKVSIDLTGLSLGVFSLNPGRDTARLAKEIGDKRKAIAGLTRLAEEVDESDLFFFSKMLLKGKIQKTIRGQFLSRPFLFKAYIDIDGVLLTPKADGESGLVSDFEGIIEFLQNNFDCYWLTTHVRGDSKTAAAKLRPHLSQKGLDPVILERINPTIWTTLKTEAIDFRLPFIWLDDDPLSAEVEVLTQKGCRDSLVIVNSGRRSGRLTVRRLKRAREKILWHRLAL